MMKTKWIFNPNLKCQILKRSVKYLTLLFFCKIPYRNILLLNKFYKNKVLKINTNTYNVYKVGRIVTLVSTFLHTIIYF